MLILPQQVCYPQRVALRAAPTLEKKQPAENALPQIVTVGTFAVFFSVRAWPKA